MLTPATNGCGCLAAGFVVFRFSCFALVIGHIIHTLLMSGVCVQVRIVYFFLFFYSVFCLVFLVCGGGHGTVIKFNLCFQRFFLCFYVYIFSRSTGGCRVCRTQYGEHVVASFYCLVCLTAYYICDHLSRMKNRQPLGVLDVDG